MDCRRAIPAGIPTADIRAHITSVAGVSAPRAVARLACWRLPAGRCVTARWLLPACWVLLRRRLLLHAVALAVGLPCLGHVEEIVCAAVGAAAALALPDAVAPGRGALPIGTAALAATATSTGAASSTRPLAAAPIEAASIPAATANTVARGRRRRRRSPTRRWRRRRPRARAASCSACASTTSTASTASASTGAAVGR